jgi:hypothetical protein
VTFIDPCRLVRQVKQFFQLDRSACALAIIRGAELLHLPGKPAGVEGLAEGKLF